MLWQVLRLALLTTFSSELAGCDAISFISGPGGNPACWYKELNYETCCPPNMSGGNQICWQVGPHLTYTRCCEKSLGCEVFFSREEWDAILLTADLHSEAMSERRGFFIRRFEQLYNNAAAYRQVAHHCPEGLLALCFHALRAFYNTKGGMAMASHALRHLFTMERRVEMVLPMNMFLHILHAYTVDFPESRRDLVARNVGRQPWSVLERYHAKHFAEVRPLYDQRTSQLERPPVTAGFKGSHSVDLSEAFPVVAFCALFGVQVVLESGVHEGFSTEIWARWGVRVVAMDLRLLDSARKRLQPFGEAVKLLEANAVEALPEQAARLTEAAAVVIDGPKREAALRLARDALGRSTHVKFAAVHDMRHFKHTSAFAEHGLEPFFFSNDEWFTAAHGDLDKDPCTTVECRYRRQQVLDMDGAGGVFAFVTAAEPKPSAGAAA